MKTTCECGWKFSCWIFYSRPPFERWRNVKFTPCGTIYEDKLKTTTWSTQTNLDLLCEFHGSKSPDMYMDKSAKLSCRSVLHIRFLMQAEILQETRLLGSVTNFRLQCEEFVVPLKQGSATFGLQLLCQLLMLIRPKTWFSKLPSSRKTASYLEPTFSSKMFYGPFDRLALHLFSRKHSYRPCSVVNGIVLTEL